MLKESTCWAVLSLLFFRIFGLFRTRHQILNSVKRGLAVGGGNSETGVSGFGARAGGEEIGDSYTVGDYGALLL